MAKYMIRNIHLVNEGKTKVQDVLIEHRIIAKIGDRLEEKAAVTEIDGTGLHLLPGVIDDQVHFRDPGLTHKGNLFTESRAAVAGGVTSYMEMPNTIPNALTHALLEEKYANAAKNSLANYSFFMGTSNDNVDEVLRTNERKKDVCGIKIFMGSSTGNMLVDNYITLNRIFSEAEVLIATHCEDERIIRQNREALSGETLQAWHHPLLRNVEACFESSLSAIQLAKRYHTRLHILHISTALELNLFTNLFPTRDKRITSEVCVHHLHFTADDYARLGYRIKCNPAIKAAENKAALWEALLDDRLDIIATDHAPHLLSEKEPPYDHAHAGLPLVQHALPLMLHYVQEGRISLEKMVDKMSHKVADCFQIAQRGYLREGYFADMVLVDLQKPQTVHPDNIRYKCGWSPFEGMTMPATIEKTFVSGHLAYSNGVILEGETGMRMTFDR